MRLRLHGLLVGLLMTGSGGCMTADMWQQASLKTVSNPHVAGSLAEESGRPGGVIVAYDAQGVGWFKDRPAYAVVRLNPDGSVPEPFGCPDVPPHWSDVVDQVSQAQADQIRAQVFTEERWAAGKAAMTSPRFRRLNDREGVTTIDAVRIETRGLSPVAFWPGGTGLDQRADWSRPLPPNSRVMVLPNAEPRPSGDRTANIVEAAALTPVMLAADVVVDPIACVLWVFGGEPGGVICVATPAPETGSSRASAAAVARVESHVLRCPAFDDRRT